MPPRLADRLSAARRRRFIGRSNELQIFEHVLEANEPPFYVLIDTCELLAPLDSWLRDVFLRDWQRSGERRDLGALTDQSGVGMTPSCCSMPMKSQLTQDSAILPCS